MNKFNCYSILKVSNQFTKDELDSCFRNLMMYIYHNNKLSESDKKIAYDIVMDNYNILKDPVSKQNYDRELVEFYSSFKEQANYITSKAKYLHKLPSTEVNEFKINMCISTLLNLRYIRDNNSDLQLVESMNIAHVKRHRCHK